VWVGRRRQGRTVKEKECKTQGSRNGKKELGRGEKNRDLRLRGMAFGDMRVRARGWVKGNVSEIK